MSYGINYSETYRRSAAYVARMLDGEHSSELPVQKMFDFIINLAVARELGITFPNKILFAATEVIE